ncbi:hypothetical protein A3C34_02365 [Candidatus Amesbacteria bacterium RIFCSPHIGHO2_02_FULL_48_21]|uniref:Penicillin-binding protein, 1A family n=1 Tax=Candidatus Amesbacteria bacterium GW2011_GWA2_47_11 TaxID=1618357 RepID=A0A0G1RHA0_9BACT|nr:MAG: Penicillin-binding protein, 1A family [Candidatus Amesbacteria bacterium GW2011_GWA2_47_11]OGC96205.1 MAG: hypothetical protein A3C34_02365 [Candidatus Amesbacteria bacterium RIFCSPHIGHO2_02_FULL_48_21]
MPSLKSFLKSAYPLIHFFSQLPRPKPAYILLPLIFIALFTITIYYYLLKDLPSPSSLSSAPLPLTTHIRDRNGIELYQVYSSQNRTLIKLADLPPHVKQAIIAIEDKDFYSHRGFSVRGILRALFNTLKSPSRLKCTLSTEHCSLFTEGGSTITQQLVKTALLSPERTLSRKLRELILAIAVEQAFSKDQILEMYLNRVGFGGAAYGIEAAAQTYFGKSATALNIAEAALLAGLPASPTTYSPFGAHPELALSRQREVLRHMVAAGFLTWDQAESSSSVQLTLNPPQNNIKAPHFVMYIKELLAQKFGSEIVEQGGLDVTTSLDLPLQETVQRIVAEEIAKVDYLQITNGAAVVTHPQTGDILSLVGSRDFFDVEHDGQFNITRALRQPGSAIKPINYALAFSRNFTAGSYIDDSPVTFRIPGQEPYSPVNYDRRFHGRVTLRTALASSYNVPAVKLLAAGGVEHMIGLGQQMGISSWTDLSRYGLSLTLGGGEVTMLDMAQVYGTFAASGTKADLRLILEIRDSTGRILEKTPTPSPRPVLDPRIAFLISDILSDNAARTPTFGPNSLLFIPGSQVAVKTGTTNNLRDNWTIGYTPDRVVVVWVGNNDNSPMSYIASGVTGAAPIWRSITDHLLSNHPSVGFTPPPDLTKIAVCGNKPEYFLNGTQPNATCAPSPSSPHDQILTGASTVNPPAPTSSPAVLQRKFPKKTKLR